jgi:SAM-dependent methyltransferase
MKIDRASWTAVSELMARRVPGTELEAAFARTDDASSTPDRRAALRAIEMMRGSAEHESLPVADTLDVAMRAGAQGAGAPTRRRVTFAPRALDEADRLAAMDRFIAMLATPSLPASSAQNSKRMGALDGAVSLTEKRLVGSVSVPEFSMRVNLRTETEQELASMRDMAASSEPASMRLKRRFSFMLSPRFRLDITAVRFAAFAAHARIADVMAAPETYEFEVECIAEGNAKAPTTDDAFKVSDETDALARELLGHFSMVLKLVDDSEVAMANSAKRSVLELYQSLARARSFAGPKPATLEIANLLSGEFALPNATAPLLDHAYTVTEKADGERRLLLIDDEMRLFTIDDRMRVHAMSASLRASEPRCLLDGEFVTSTDPGQPAVFAVFDAYVADGKDVSGLPLVDGSAAGKKKEQGACRVAIAKRVLAGLPDDRVFVKTFLYGAGGAGKPAARAKAPPKTASILEQAGEVLRRRDAGLFPYEIDGLIFTPAALPVGGSFQMQGGQGGGHWSRARTWREVLKWKPPESSTIDFQVQLRSGAGAPSNAAWLLVGYNDEGANGTRSLRSFLAAMALGKGAGGNGKNAPHPSGAQYEARPFAFMEPPPSGGGAAPLHEAQLPIDLRCENGDLITDGCVVEFRYAGAPSAHRPENWRPTRVRFDKTESSLSTGRVTANNYHTAMSVWRTILYPVTEAVVAGREKLDQAATRAAMLESVYFIARMRSDEGGMVPMRKFHSFVKTLLISSLAPSPAPRIFDFGVGKAGDLHKWVRAGASKVVGVDKFAANLTDPANGAFARMLQARERGEAALPDVLFFPADAAGPLFEEEEAGGANNVMDPDTAALANAAFLGRRAQGDADDEVSRSVLGMARAGTFDLAACMFAMHYFFETPERLEGLCRNVATALRPGGVFVGVGPDGDAIAKLLLESDGGVAEGREASAAGRLLWRITRRYDPAEAKSGEEACGRQVDVFVESIGQEIPEYLMYYKTLVRAMHDAGLRPLNAAELRASGLGRYSTGMLEAVYQRIVEGGAASGGAASGGANSGGGKSRKQQAFAIDQAPDTLRRMLAEDMTEAEKAYSFLTRWVAFKKLDEGEAQAAKDAEEVRAAQEAAAKAAKAAKARAAKAAKAAAAKEPKEPKEPKAAAAKEPKEPKAAKAVVAKKI